MEVNAVPGKHQPTDVICPHPSCGLAFGNLRTLRKHFELHNASSQTVKCGSCHHTFPDLTVYQKHSRSGICSPACITPVASEGITSSSKRPREPEGEGDLAKQQTTTVAIVDAQ